MQYLVFGTLLVLGAVVMGLFLYCSHAKNKIEAVVLESCCDLKRDEHEIESIRVTHTLEFESDGDKKKVETDCLPVRELNGAKLSFYYNKKEEKVYIPDNKKYYALLAAFFLSGLLCFGLYLYQMIGFALLQKLAVAEWFALLLGVIAIVAFSYVTTISNPLVLRTKGNFEGILKSEDESGETEVYSLWYGEHRQYAKRTGGMLLKHNSEKAVTLYFNTRTGQVRRLHEFVISMCVSAVAFLAMVVVLLLR